MIEVAISTFRKNRKTIIRAYPWSFIFGRLTGGISTVIIPVFIFTYFFNGETSSTFLKITNSKDYMTYIVIGAAINTLGVATLMNVGRSFIMELREGTIEPFLMSPASRLGYFLGCLFEQFGRSVMELVIIMMLGVIFGAKLMGILSFGTLVAFILTIIGFFSMAILLASVMLYTRDTYITQNTLFYLLSFTTGVSFPVEYLPHSIQFFSQFIPMTHAIKLFRNVVMNHQSISSNLGNILVLIVLSLLYFIIGFAWFKNIEKKLIEEIFE